MPTERVVRVVTKGSKTRATKSELMPRPLSLIRTRRTFCDCSSSKATITRDAPASTEFMTMSKIFSDNSLIGTWNVERRTWYVQRTTPHLCLSTFVFLLWSLCFCLLEPKMSFYHLLFLLPCSAHHTSVLPYNTTLILCRVVQSCAHLMIA